MSIPLDRLYNYIENIAKEINTNVLIYRFWPHGSKKIENLEELTGPPNWSSLILNIHLTCHDQEPLNYEIKKFDTSRGLDKILHSLSLLDYSAHNLQKNKNIYNKMCLLHSEKRSDQLVRYQNHNCIPVYYWSHAVIALDWFRYAQHVTQQKQATKKFLIYNRAWAGTREYRLYFADLLIKLGLHDHCKTSVNAIEPELGIHYHQHQFKNPVWRPQTLIENYLPINKAQSYYSADFDIEDYEGTEIEVVLETLFDDARLHLTEKSLRPIACGQPFILAGTHGSLEYLHSYGFKTFGDIWDESYDLIEDPHKRLIKIVDLMKNIADWTPEQLASKMVHAQEIADYNKKHFFSKHFFDLVIKELTTNLSIGLSQVSTDVESFISRWEHLLTFEEIINYLEITEDPTFKIPKIEKINSILNYLRNSK